METLQEIEVPLKLIDEVVKTGATAFKAAHEITVPTMIVQGSHDPRVANKTTDKLRKRFPARPWYLEVDCGHNLMSTHELSWDVMSESVVQFVETKFEMCNLSLIARGF